MERCSGRPNAHRISSATYLTFHAPATPSRWFDIDINKTLDDTIQLLEPQLRKSNVEIIKDYSDLPVIVSNNGGKLQQIFTNLILNARDAILDGGTITATTSVNGGEVVANVTDTGIGIAEDDLQKIFDPFFTTKGVGNGTGLGLAVSYGIVQEHSGSIEAASNGTGTTFTVKFPEAGTQRQRKAS